MTSKAVDNKIKQAKTGEAQGRSARSANEGQTKRSKGNGAQRHKQQEG